MVASFAPQRGDVVIREDSLEHGRVFILSIAPGADQFFLHTLEAAIARAVSFARSARVCVWLAKADSEFTLIEDFRGSPRSIGRA
jgi:hypothetical protein